MSDAFAFSSPVSPAAPAAKRLGLLDTLRGLTLLSMILYHAVWDAVFLFGAPWAWFRGEGAFLWQQSICWTFIFLSGFCWPFSRRPLRRGAVVFLAGAAVTAVTLVFSPQDRIVFGILTFLGSAMLLLTALEPLLRPVPSWAGLLVSGTLFALLRSVNSGWLALGSLRMLALPKWLYQGLFATYLGFTDAEFGSADYFSLLPWFFLFLAGYFSCRLLRPYLHGLPALQAQVLPLSWLGRHSLPVYLLHQPVLYAAFSIWYALF